MFYQGDGAVFFDVHDPDRTVVIELEHEDVRRLVIEVSDPNVTASAIRAALPVRAGGAN